MNNQLSDERRDALKEIVSIGAGNAATALSQLLKQKVSIIVPKVEFSSIDTAQDIFGPPETQVVTVYLQLLGDASGVILLSLKAPDALRLADMLMGKAPASSRMLGEMGESALMESVTILTGAYLAALSRMLKMRLLISSPAMAQDMAGAIVDNILIETSKEADYTLVIDTELEIINEKITAFFFFIPEKKSLEKILRALGA